LLLARFSGDIARSAQPVSATADAAAPEMSPLVASALQLAVATEASDQASDKTSNKTSNKTSDKPADASTAIKLGRCNDLVVLPWGDIAFTDFGSRDKAAPSKGLFLLRREAGAEARATCVDPEFKAANGLAFDAARGVLYVADYGAAQIIAYDLGDASRTPTNRRIFAGLADARRQHKLQGMVDGMKVDPATGNLLTTGPGGIWVLSPDGERLALLPIEGASNLAIDGKVVYITAGTGVWRAELK
jgi:gluconolactonase